MDDGRTDGVTVAEHGLWCSSGQLAWIDSHDAESGRRVLLSAAVVRPYLHGTYHRTVTWRRPYREEQVQLTLSDGDSDVLVVNVNVGDALRLAASLTRACAVADRHDQDFNEAKSRRRQARLMT